MIKYLLTVFSDDKDKNGEVKTKTIVCLTDFDVFAKIQECLDAGLIYEVEKAETVVVLTNKPRE